MEIVMPRLSDSMEQGTILSWLKAPGESVQLSDELLEIETDKATVTYSAEGCGVLEIIASEGTTVAVGDQIGRLLEAPAPGVVASAGSAPPTPGVTTVRPSVDTSTGRGEIPQAASVEPSGIGSRNDRGRTVATPLARRTAAVHGVALDEIQGTGPLGRITRADVLDRAGLGAGPSMVVVAPSPSRSSSTRHEPSRLQQIIARRMSESKATIPHFQVQTEVVMDAAIALRAELKVVAGDMAPSVNDLIIKATALALLDHPLANGSFRDGAFELHEAINIGIAVATDDALVVPTVVGADGKSLGQIARETRTLAARVRSAQITPAELDGATFTISNLGMFGMTAITPVINPPQAAILGVGATRDTLARVDGQIVDRSQLTLTLSCDHRILYGAEAARFLRSIRDVLEAPLRMVL
jgi:pyruvate dehydrogenase E2 component (dihydrolipoamide acetyltransferase)